MQENQVTETSADIYVNPANAEIAPPGADFYVSPEHAEPKVETETAKVEVKTEEKPKEPEAKKPNRVQERIGEITAARREAERKAEAAEKRVAALEARLAEKEKTLVAPNPEEFSDTGEYAKAVARYEGKLSAHEVLRDEVKHEKTLYTEEARAALTESWTERVRDAEETIPNFKETIAKAQDFPITPHLESEIMESDMGPQLLMHFALNPREAIHLGRLSPKALSREILKLELRLEDSQKPVAVEPKVTKAPAPIAPITARNSSPSGDDYSSWAARRNAESHIKR